MANHPVPANILRRETVSQERFETLLEHPLARIERIWGPVASPSEIYEQAHDEWILLLAGQAKLEICDGPSHVLAAGDYLMIPAGQRHRVLHASAEALWLAVHFAGPADRQAE